MTDLDEQMFVESLDDEALFEWDDEASDDESYFRPQQPNDRRRRSRQSSRPKLAPMSRDRSAARRLATNDQRLARNDRALAQGQQKLDSRIDDIESRTSKLPKFEKTMEQRIKALESSSQLAMLLPLLSSQPELASFEDEDTGQTIKVRTGTTKFQGGDGFDPILLLALSGGMTGSSNSTSGNGQDGLFSSPLGLVLMLKLLDR